MTDETFNKNSIRVPTKRLWFGFAGAAVAWTAAGALDVIWTGQGCVRSEACQSLAVPGWIEILLGAITFALLAVAVVSGVISYRNWKRLANNGDFVEAEGRERQEFMALFGVLVSVTLGVGIIWFILPIYLITSCTRAH